MLPKFIPTALRFFQELGRAVAQKDKASQCVSISSRLAGAGEVTGSSPVSDHQPGCFAVIAAASELNRLF